MRFYSRCMAPCRRCVAGWIGLHVVIIMMSAAFSVDRCSDLGQVVISSNAQHDINDKFDVITVLWCYPQIVSSPFDPWAGEVYSTYEIFLAVQWGLCHVHRIFIQWFMYAFAHAYSIKFAWYPPSYSVEPFDLHHPPSERGCSVSERKP